MVICATTKRNRTFGDLLHNLSPVTFIHVLIMVYVEMATSADAKQDLEIRLSASREYAAISRERVLKDVIHVRRALTDLKLVFAKVEMVVHGA